MKLFAQGAGALSLALILFACDKEPTRWDSASATAKSAAETAKPSPPKTEGDALNRYFPRDGESGYSRIFTQEKAGFVEARLNKDGVQVATMSISDTNGDQVARKKFDAAPDKVGGAPLVTIGKNQSAALVGRYQVKVSSPTLDPMARKALLEKFDLPGLARLPANGEIQ